MAAIALLGEIGTLEWTRRTRGILGRGERGRLLVAITLSQLRNTPGLLGRRFGLERGGVGPDPSEIVLPDSKLARQTVELCEESLDPAVVAHSIRSHVFAHALALANGHEVDPEELFVGALMHDWGFVELETLDDNCFTLVGAERAIELCVDAGLGIEKAERVGESITSHINPSVGPERGLTQHLVHDGVFCDIFSIRAAELDRSGVRRVFERRPKQGFPKLAAQMLGEHARRVPGCRVEAAFQAGFGLALRLA